MSASLYNGGLVGAIDAERRPRIADDGNWAMQGTSEGPAYRSLALYVGEALVYGYRPEPQREPFADAVRREGVFTREELLQWRGPQLVAGQVCEMILKGGNRYLGWGDTAGEDWMEWASLSPVTLQPVVATTGRITVPSTQPPPAPSFQELRAHAVKDLDAALAKVERPRVSAPRALAARMCFDASGEQTRKVLEVFGQ